MSTALAASVEWGGLPLHLVVAYVPPMTDPHCARLLAGGLETRAADTLVELDALLGLLPCGEEPVILMGDLNARTGNLIPSTPDHPPCVSADTSVLARGRALLELAGRHGLFVVNGLSVEMGHATRPSAISGAGLGTAGTVAGSSGVGAPPTVGSPPVGPLVGYGSGVRSGEGVGSGSGSGSVTRGILGLGPGMDSGLGMGPCVASASASAGGVAASPGAPGGVASPDLQPGTVVDYCLVSRAAYDLLAGARVCDHLDGSDHVPLHVALRTPLPAY